LGLIKENKKASLLGIKTALKLKSTVVNNFFKLSMHKNQEVEIPQTSGLKSRALDKPS
jgi:hypothetical protein